MLLFSFKKLLKHKYIHWTMFTVYRTKHTGLVSLLFSDYIKDVLQRLD